MRPPDQLQNRNAAGASRGVGDRHHSGSIKQPLDKPISSALQASIFTAVPSGRYWQVKATSPDGDVARFGNFHDRLTALGRGPEEYCNIGYFGEIANARHASELQGIIDFCARTRWSSRAAGSRNCAIATSITQFVRAVPEGLHGRSMPFQHHCP
jgi:hypothetical protein